MTRKTATRVLVLWVIVAASSVCLAQRNVLPTAPPPDKKPCDVLTKADAESIMGQPAEWRQNNPFQCDYVETGWTNKPPKNKRVSLSVSTSASANPNALADTWKNLADHPMPTRVSKNLPNFADAAIWNWYQGHGGEVFAYKAGTISVSVLVTGLPEDAALEPRQSNRRENVGWERGNWIRLQYAEDHAADGQTAGGFG